MRIAGEIDICQHPAPGQIQVVAERHHDGRTRRRHHDASPVAAPVQPAVHRHPLQAGLPSEHTNGHRLTLRYFFEDRATRAMLSRRAQSGGTMQQAMCRSVAEHYKGRPFLWSLPQSGADGGVRDNFWKVEDGAFRPKLRLPGRSFGLNQWREHHNLALLSVINLIAVAV